MGTLEYLAPEILMRDVASFATDVYAFAITVNELATQTRPYSDRKRSVALEHTILDYSYNNDDLAKAIASEGLRPHLPDHDEAGLSSLLKQCWAQQAADRPALAQVTDELDSLAYKQFGALSASELNGEWKEKRDLTSRAGDASINMSQESNCSYDKDAAGSLPMQEGESLATALAKYDAPFLHPEVCTAPGRKRGKDRFEDRYSVCSPSDALPGTHILGVFDGHGGYECAEFVSQNLESELSKQAATHQSIHSALKLTFEQLDASFAAKVSETESYKKGRSPGTTALVLLYYWDNCLSIASAGDCLAVACRNGTAVELHGLQHASDPTERKRIEQCEGYVTKTDAWRVGDAGLQVTRALGDVDAKRDGVISTPAVTDVTVTNEDMYLIVASDGVWDVLSPQQAVDLCEATAKEPEMMARRVADTVEDEGGFDNATVIVAALQPLASLQRVY